MRLVKQRIHSVPGQAGDGHVGHITESELVISDVVGHIVSLVEFIGRTSRQMTPTLESSSRLRSKHVCLRRVI